MSSTFNKSYSVASETRAVIIARFNSREEAEQGRDALETIFNELRAEVAELYKQQGGEANIFDIAKIYTRHGLRNDSGWEQEYPILINDEDIAWALPAGAFPEDATSLVWTLGAQDVAVHKPGLDPEDWRTAPHPMAIPIPGEEIDFFEVEDEDPIVGNAKRTLH